MYASIVGLGIFIMLMQIFSGTARKPETVRPGLLLEHLPVPRAHGRRLLLIEPLGFYAATFLCIVAMTAYGTFWLSGRNADLQGHRFGTGLFAAPHRRRVRLFLADHGSTDPYGASVLTLRPKDISYGHNGIENTA